MPIIQYGREEVILSAAGSLPLSTGESPKSFLTDGINLYIVKQPKTRTFAQIFKSSFPLELREYQDWTAKDFSLKCELLPAEHRKKLMPYFQHLNDILFEAAFGEVLYQRIAKALFASYSPTISLLHVDALTGEPCILSKFRSDFNEFIEKKLVAAMGKTIKKTAEWDREKAPSRADLKFIDNEHYLLGKLYAVALLTHDWDVVNNIMASNAGCIGDSRTSDKITVVDGGNKFHFGYGGLTCDESVFENREFNVHSLQTHPLSGYNFTMPFDEEVYLDLPRLLVRDLFSLTNTQSLRGFKEVIAEARMSIMANPFCIQQAINEAALFITKDSHKPTIERFKSRSSTLLNYSYYYPSRSTQYSLEGILKARCHSLVMICQQLEYGMTIEEINRTTLAHYHQTQELPEDKKKKVLLTKSPDFFSPLTTPGIEGPVITTTPTY